MALLPEIPANWVCHLEQEDTWRINNTKTLDRRHILIEDELGVSSWMQQSFSVSTENERGVTQLYRQRHSRLSQCFYERTTLVHSLQAIS